VGILKGKKGLILGVANNKSIAWGVARAARREGATLGFNYLGDQMEKRVRPLAESLDAEIIAPMNVSDEASMDAFFAKVKEQWGELDFIVHSIAFANKDALRDGFANTSREDFHLALDISAYSFIACTQRAAPMMKEGARFDYHDLSGWRTCGTRLWYYGSGQGGSGGVNPVSVPGPRRARYSCKLCVSRADQDAGCICSRRFPKIDG